MSQQITRGKSKASDEPNRNMSSLLQLQRDVKGIFMRYQRKKDGVNLNRKALTNKFYLKIIDNNQEGHRKQMKINLLQQNNRDFKNSVDGM